ncbi:SDR family oxidoreductase [Nakamurella sp. GG22]
MTDGPQRKGQALVVGASSDIGRAIAVSLGRLGYDLTLWGRDGTRLAKTRKDCLRYSQAVVDHVDVTDRGQLTSAAQAVAARGPLTAVIWAAGLFDWATADAADVETWDRLFDVNLVSAAALTRLVLPGLIAASPSALVYIGSGSSRQVFPNNAAYIASKHGLAGLAGGVFLDVRDRGVRVSLVSPGLVAAGAGLTSPAGQSPDTLLQPSDVAAAVAFVVTFPGTGCPTEITLQPQRRPSE